MRRRIAARIMTTALSDQVASALALFERYLRDDVPPGSAADAVAALMAQPPDVLMQRVATWAAEQNSIHPVTIGALLLYAMKKVYIMGELGLLDREAVATFLDRATTIAIRICPEEERLAFRADVAAMRASRDLTATLPTAPPPAQLPQLAQTEAQTAKRFSMIVDRLTQQMQTAGPQGAQPDVHAVAQLLTMAAARAQSGQQLNDYLEQIRPLAGGKEGNVFVILGGAMPGWDLPDMAPGGRRPPAQVGAMEKIIELAEDPAAAMRRFKELVSAAVQKFNDGSLAAAVWMLDVAQDSIAEKKLDAAAAARVLSEAADSLDNVQLRRYTETRSKLPALRAALEYFPTLRLDTLFAQLRGEPRADRRRTLLTLIEAYGAAGRELALAELQRELERSGADTYYLRNCIFILHRIQRESADGVEHELELLARASARGQSIYVVREAATALGQIRTDASVTLLTTRLAELEAVLLRGNSQQYPASETQKLLDRIIASLARIGTPAALLTVARHGMKPNAVLGDTRTRLAALAQHDLSFDEATVDVLVKALRDEIPGKLFGRLLPKKQDSTLRLIEALSGTRTDAVETLFADIATRFAEQPVGRAAAQALETWSPATAATRGEPAATLAGELEFFGLPSVMQSLADMRATGLLTISTKQGQAAAKVAIAEGKFLNAQLGAMRGEEAVYQLMERPIAGSFAFVPHPPEKMKTSLAPIDVMGLLLEGCRRHDELQRVTALVPDDMRLAKTAVKPTPHEDESDPALVRDVWVKVVTGAPVAECERAVASDSYRVRRLIAHWLEQGALVAAVS
jgi:Domain of unknown function (DUF4388)